MKKETLQINKYVWVKYFLPSIANFIHQNLKKNYQDCYDNQGKNEI